MQVAEEQFWTKIQLQERLNELIKDKFRLIQKTEDENAPFKKVFALSPFFWIIKHCQNRNGKYRMVPAFSGFCFLLSIHITHEKHKSFANEKVFSCLSFMLYDSHTS